MKRNVSGQAVGAEVINATTGAAFVGAVTVFVTGDAGVQAVGSVGAGACVHEGNGYHTYLPAQAETDFALAAFTFTGAGAIPATVQVYTAPASIVTDIGNEVSIQLDVYGALRPTVPGRTLDVSAGGAAGVDWANVEAQASVVTLSNTTIALVTALAPAERDAIADAILNRDYALVADTNQRTLLNSGRFLRNRWHVVAGVLTVYEEDDATVAWTGGTIGTAGANPITEVDPA